jgi:hypothetical protein
MTSKRNIDILPDEIFVNKIYFIRQQSVMIDSDLAELYGVSTGVLNQAIKRNINRFPEDFMFALNEVEFESLKSQIVISNRGGRRTPPNAFTEAGIAMLSGVLNSETAIKVNIRIIRIFIKMREFLFTNKDLLLKMEKLEKQVVNQGQSIRVVFDYLDQFMVEKETTRTKIGFRTKGDKK